jgi:thioesterase domain-containing protein
VSEETEHLALLGSREKLSYTIVKLGRVPARLGKRVEHALGLASAVDVAFRRVAEAHRQAVRSHRLGVYPGPAVLFRAGRRLAHHFIDPELGWGSWVAGGLTVRFIAGGSGAVLKGDRARALAEELRPWLSSR